MSKIPGIPQPSALGTPAVSQGPADLNESVSDEERSGVPLSALGEGPKRSETGGYLPARYQRLDEVIQTANGPVKVTGVIVEDR